jgi:hypothetical protein
MNVYTVLWKTGSRDLFWHLGLEFDEFKLATDDFHKLGYRIVSLDVSNGLFTAVWKRGDYGQFWVRVDSGDIDDQIKHFDKKGYRMVYIDYDNGQVSMVFEPGDDAHYYCYGEDFDTFKQLDKQHFDGGKRLRWVSVDEGPSFAAIWRTGSGSQFWYYTTTFNDFIARNNEHKAQGLMLECVDKTHDPGHYCGVVRPGSGDQHVDFLGHEAIVEEDKKMAKQGMALCVIRRHYYNDGGLFPDLGGWQK